MLPTSNENLLEQVLAPENLNHAWKRVCANKGSAGIDGLSIDKFVDHFKAHGKAIVEAIRQDSYSPYPVKRIYIPKEKGGVRGLGIPTVFDRVIQQAIVQILTPIFDPTFSENSYGFRPGKSQHHAVKRIQEYSQQGRKIAVDVDLSKFFDRVNHDLLMTILGKRIRDKLLLKLIAKYLRAGIVEEGVWIECREGVPQGGPLSPLLSNIMLDILDKELERRQHSFARYADDFIILVKSKAAGIRVLASITGFIERKLKLQVNNQKSSVKPISQCQFLGFAFTGKSIKWHDDAEIKFKHQLKQLTGRSRGISMEARINQLNLFLRGWINYFGIGQGFQKCIDLDQWVRRRLRMCYLKEWRSVRTKIYNMRKLGVPLDLAISCGASRKSYWRSSKTEGIHRALSNEFFEQKNLFSLRNQWIKIHYP